MEQSDLTDLKLTPRTLNKLRKYEEYYKVKLTPDMLSQWQPHSILRIKGVGRGSYEEIVAGLDRAGFNYTKKWRLINMEKSVRDTHDQMRHLLRSLADLAVNIEEYRENYLE